MGGSIRIVVAELTMQGGRTTGEVATSITEGNRTTTTRRRVDIGPPVRLSAAQASALAAIAAGRPVAGNDEGWVKPDCPRPTLRALERLRVIEWQGYDGQGVMCGAGLCRITDAGRAALAAARPSRLEPSR